MKGARRGDRDTRNERANLDPSVMLSPDLSRLLDYYEREPVANISREQGDRYFRIARHPPGDVSHLGAFDGFHALWVSCIVFLLT